MTVGGSTMGRPTSVWTDPMPRRRLVLSQCASGTAANAAGWQVVVNASRNVSPSVSRNGPASKSAKGRGDSGTAV